MGYHHVYLEALKDISLTRLRMVINMITELIGIARVEIAASRIKVDRV
jgi:hypothetical protein